MSLTVGLIKLLFKQGPYSVFRRAVLCLVTQSCLTLCDPMDCSPPGSSLSMRILQARILEWVAMPSSSCHALLLFPTQESNPLDGLLFKPSNLKVFFFFFFSLLKETGFLSSRISQSEFCCLHPHGVIQHAALSLDVSCKHQSLELDCDVSRQWWR